MYNIIDEYVEANDHLTRQSLSLTCRALRPYCCQQLFKTFYVGPRSSTVSLPKETTELSPAAKFTVLMKESPDLAECIHAIHRSNTEQLDASDGSQGQLTREEESIVYPQAVFDKPTFVRLASDAREDVWAHLPGQFTEAITATLRTTSLQGIHLITCQYQSTSFGFLPISND